MAKSISIAPSRDEQAREAESINREETAATYADLERLSLYKNAGIVNNRERAAIAAAALIPFAKRTGQDLHGVEPVREIVVDLLANLMHLCDQLGVTDVEPFASLNESAWRHFIIEQSDENPIPF